MADRFLIEIDNWKLLSETWGDFHQLSVYFQAQDDGLDIYSLSWLEILRNVEFLHLQNVSIH